MDRKEILEELKKYNTVPGHGKPVSELTDKQLLLRLRLFETMSQAADEALREK